MLFALSFARILLCETAHSHSHINITLESYSSANLLMVLVHDVIIVYLSLLSFLYFYMITRIIIIFYMINNYLLVIILCLLIDNNIIVFPNRYRLHLCSNRTPLQLGCFTFILKYSLINSTITIYYTKPPLKVSLCNFLSQCLSIYEM